MPLMALIKRVHLGNGAVESVKFFGSDDRILTTSDEPGVKVWKIWDRQLECVIGAKAGPISQTCFTSGLTQLIGTGMDSFLYVWDVPSGRSVWTREADFSLLCCDISSDNQTIATGSDFNHDLTLWDLRTGNPVASFSSFFSGSITSVAFCPDKLRLAAVSLDDPVKIFDLRVNKPTLTLHDDSVIVTDLSWCRDGRKLLTSAMNSRVYVYDVSTGEYRDNPERLSPLIDRPACFTCCDWSSLESRWFACGSTDGHVSVWDADRNEGLFDLLSHADAMIKDCAFSPSGNCLITVCSDGTGRLWLMDDLKSTKRYKEKVENYPFVKKCCRCGTRFRGHVDSKEMKFSVEDLCPYCRLRNATTKHCISDKTDIKWK
ncbi:uncharacterized protein LOC129584667 isoform X2 [Paramacrobiotus metropolitanus]|uniref:uncharacterized protein LOC129584667 isoform X2 n=1 Tax=Paramacrobiotus metropolitanus TaxID=2943436 RepID=UPI0024460E15|nr:uncharacterized protein LOC129584667 isoform X2 [Paramacrobiotus metropolitanus]